MQTTPISGWFPIHLHCLPPGMTSASTRGMLLCCEWRKPQLADTYDAQNWPDSPGKRLHHFMEQWPKIRPKNWPDCPVVFSVEAECDLGDVWWLPRMKNAGLQAVQIYRDGIEGRYIDPFSGLTDDGKDLLDALADEGMLVDLSHLQGALLRHVLDNAAGGKILSHVACREIQIPGVVSRSNAMTDEELRLCDALLYGVPFIDDLVSLRGTWEMEHRDTNPALVARHILHLASVVGAERVALGPDFQDAASARTSRIQTVPGMDHIAGLEELHALLLQSGMTREEVDGVFYGNAMRVLLGETD